MAREQINTSQGPLNRDRELSRQLTDAAAKYAFAHVEGATFERANDDHSVPTVFVHIPQQEDAIATVRSGPAGETPQMLAMLLFQGGNGKAIEPPPGVRQRFVQLVEGSAKAAKSFDPPLAWVVKRGTMVEGLGGISVQNIASAVNAFSVQEKAAGRKGLARPIETGMSGPFA